MQASQQHGHMLGQEAAGTPASRAALAIDTPSLFYRIMYVTGNIDAACDTFYSLFSPLAAAGIRLLFVFDAVHKPNKGPEQERRAARNNSLRQKRKALQAFLTEEQPCPEDGDVCEWMNRASASREQLGRVERQLDVIRPTDYPHLRRFLTGCGWATLMAHDEGEAACCWLVQHGHACAVMSEDFDTLPGGARVFIRNYGANPHKRPCEAVCLDRVLAALGMTYSMFVQFCVLCGSDFTHHLPGMGPAKATKTMLVYKSLQEYLLSTAYKKEYGHIPFHSETALAQFLDVQPPGLALPTALGLFVCAAFLLMGARKRALRAAQAQP